MFVFGKFVCLVAHPDIEGLDFVSKGKDSGRGHDVRFDLIDTRFTDEKCSQKKYTCNEFW